MVVVAAAVRITPRERRESFFGNLLGNIEAAKEIRLFGIGDHLRGLMRTERGARGRPDSAGGRRDGGRES